MSRRAPRESIERAIAYNARCLGEKPVLGVHVLRDGRVRVYELATGWRRRPYRQYQSLERARAASLKAVVDSRRVRAQLRAGADKQAAVDRVLHLRLYGLVA